VKVEARARKANPKVHIRQLLESDLGALREGLGASHAKYFRKHLPQQNAEQGMILVAFLGSLVVGAGLVLWGNPADERKLRLRLPGVPLLYHVHVRPMSRCRGIGTQLLAAVHAELRSRGYSHVTLGVDSKNKDAWRLYERLGYELWEDGHWGRGGTSYRAMVLDLQRDPAEFLGAAARQNRTLPQKLRQGLINDVIGELSTTPPELNQPLPAPIKKERPRRVLEPALC
jgi:ribosomal protein S18 acetylase RimI-like enzyme